MKAGANGEYSSGAAAILGALLGTASMLSTGALAAGEWHPQSFYEPSIEPAPGHGTILDDGSVAWPHDPRAPTGR